MSSKEEMYQKIETLSQIRPFARQAVAQVTGCDLGLTESNEYFEMLEGKGRADGVFSFAELRLPKPSASAKDGLLILQVNPELGLCITEDEVMARYNVEPILSPPLANEPPDSPVYFDYPQPWGMLSLGFSREDEPCLIRVVLDATGT